MAANDSQLNCRHGHSEKGYASQRRLPRSTTCHTTPQNVTSRALHGISIFSGTRFVARRPITKRTCASQPGYDSTASVTTADQRGSAPTSYAWTSLAVTLQTTTTATRLMRAFAPRQRLTDTTDALHDVGSTTRGLQDPASVALG